MELQLFVIRIFFRLDIADVERCEKLQHREKALLIIPHIYIVCKFRSIRRKIWDACRCCVRRFFISFKRKLNKQKSSLLKCEKEIFGECFYIGKNAPQTCKMAYNTNATVFILLGIYTSKNKFISIYIPLTNICAFFLFLCSVYTFVSVSFTFLFQILSINRNKRPQPIGAKQSIVSFNTEMMTISQYLAENRNG